MIGDFSAVSHDVPTCLQEGIDYNPAKRSPLCWYRSLYRDVHLCVHWWSNLLRVMLFSIGRYVLNLLWWCPFLLAGAFIINGCKARLCLHKDCELLSITCHSACRTALMWEKQQFFLYAGWDWFTCGLVSFCLQDGMKLSVITFHPCLGWWRAVNNNVYFCLQRYIAFFSAKLQSDGGDIPNFLFWSASLLAKRRKLTGYKVYIYRRKDSKRMRGWFIARILWWSSLEGINWLERVSAACGG